MSLLVPFLTGAFERIAAMSKEGRLPVTAATLAAMLPLPAADAQPLAQLPAEPPASSPRRRATKAPAAKSPSTSKT